MFSMFPHVLTYLWAELFLVLEVRKMTYGSTKDPDVQFEKWSKAVTLFVKMVLDLKTHCTRGLLTQVLKNARPFLDHFVKEGKE